MIKPLFIFVLGVGLASNVLAQVPWQVACHLPNKDFSPQDGVPDGFKLPANTNYKYGPNVDWYVQNNANVATSIATGRDVWDATNAVNRIGEFLRKSGHPLVSCIVLQTPPVFDIPMTSAAAHCCRTLRSP
jgi:hypothetical protein